MPKNFRIPAAEIKPITVGRGSCIASDEITVGGARVGFMYREPPDDAVDSGWRFLSGTETQDYLDDPGNLDVYDVNTIANYDQTIMPWLDASVGSAFERQPNADAFSPSAMPVDID